MKAWLASSSSTGDISSCGIQTHHCGGIAFFVVRTATEGNGEKGGKKDPRENQLLLRRYFLVFALAGFMDKKRMNMI